MFRKRDSALIGDLARELLETTAEARRLREENVRVRGERDEFAALAVTTAGFGEALAQAVDAAFAAEKDIAEIERAHRIVRPSRTPPPETIAALWRQLPSP